MSVAKPLPHDAAALHVTGQARYVDDIPTPKGTLHLAFGLASIAKGTITAMDLCPVRASAGVVAVLTASDLPFANDVSPSAHDEPLLATGTVHYLGQPVFLVVATSHRAARVAARSGHSSCCCHCAATASSTRGSLHGISRPDAHPSKSSNLHR